MKQQSAKARAVAKERALIRFELVAHRGSACEACDRTPVGANPARPFSDLHEILTRARGGDPTDPENILLVCRRCHDWITTHEDAARLAGLVRGRNSAEHEKIFRPWDT